MRLAKRIRELRYVKGWGPDELAHRAEVSRTALYQIECGRTLVPRAGTLLKIAKALDLPIERLLGEDDPTVETSAETHHQAVVDSVPFEETPGWERSDDLNRKFRELLASHLGEGLARLVEDSHRLLPIRQERRIS